MVPRGFKVEVFARDLNFADRHRVRRQQGPVQGATCSSPAPACRAGATTTPRSPVSANSIREESVHARHPGFQPGRSQARRPARQADRIGRRLPARRSGDRTRLPARLPGRKILRHGFEPGRPRRARPGQQHFAHRGVAFTPEQLRHGAGLPTGDHPTEQILVKDGWVYWSQGSATNAGVTGHDNGGGGNQHEIACQQITLPERLGLGRRPPARAAIRTTAWHRPGAVVPAFEGATSSGMCTGADPAHEDLQREHHAEHHRAGGVGLPQPVRDRAFRRPITR